MEPGLRSGLATAIAVSYLAAGWLGWLAIPPGNAANVGALWLSTTLVALSLSVRPLAIEQATLAGLRQPVAAATTAPLSLIQFIDSAGEPGSGLATLLLAVAYLPLVDGFADRSADRRLRTAFRFVGASLAAVLASFGLLGAVGAIQIAEVLPWAIVLLSGIAAPGLVLGTTSRRIDPERVDTTATDLVTGIALVAAGTTPFLAAALTMLGPSEGSGLVLFVAYLLAVVVAARLAVGPLARLADRTSSQRDLVVAVAEAERSRLAIELHDGPLQDLLLLARRIEGGSDPEAARLVRAIADELRETSSELRVPVLDDLGAGPALEWLVARLQRITGTEIVLEVEDEARPPATVELAVFRVAQEALANATRHGGPPIRVHYTANLGRVLLAVDDAGAGIEPDAAARALRDRRFGLVAMAGRAEQIGARFSIDRGESGGTQVRLEWLAPVPS